MTDSEMDPISCRLIDSSTHGHGTVNAPGGASGVCCRPWGLPVFHFQPSPNPCFPVLAAARKSAAESDSAECSNEFQYECIGVLSQTYQYWNSVLQSAELDSAADFRAAASIGKQGFGDG